MFGARSMRPSPALIVALLALVVAMSGTAYAAVELQKNSVLSKHIKNGQVKTKDLANGAVNGAKVRDGSLAPSDFAAGQLPAGPQGPTGPAGPAGPAGPQGVPGPTDTVTVVATATIANGAFNDARADCPAGMEAIGGGIDPGNVATMALSGSFPVVNGASRLVTVPAGQHGAATGWVGWAVNNSGSVQTMAVAVICAG